jgi:hypothetical protein
MSEKLKNYNLERKKHKSAHIDKYGHADLKSYRSLNDRPGGQFIHIHLELIETLYRVWVCRENDQSKNWDFPVTKEGLNLANDKFEEQLKIAQNERELYMTLSQLTKEYDRLDFLEKQKTQTKKEISQELKDKIQSLHNYINSNFSVSEIKTVKLKVSHKL